MGDKQEIIVLPPSKSIVNRLLIIEALGTDEILQADDITCDDTAILREALHTDSNYLNIRQSGTAMRFLTAFLSARKDGREYILDGSRRLSERPLAPLVDSLRLLGADIEYLQQYGRLPVRIVGKELHSALIDIDASESSQYVSALMLIAPIVEGGLCIKLSGCSSFPYILLTSDVMAKTGIDVSVCSDTIRISQGSYRSHGYAVEADYSSAAFWFAYFAVSDLDSLQIGYFDEKSYQPDSHIVDLIADFGVAATYSDRIITLRKADGAKARLPRSVAYDFNATPDLVPIMAVMCCMLGVEFRFSGIGHLRLKESDRIEAIVRELSKCGYNLGYDDDSIYWQGICKNVADSPRIDTHSDHRIAMAFALMAQTMELYISEPEVVSKSYPTFWADLQRYGTAASSRDVSSNRGLNV